MSMPTTSPPSTEEIVKEIFSSNPGYYMGPHFLGIVFDALLMGILLCQTCHWLPEARHDTLSVRLLVAIGVTAAFMSAVFGWAKYMLDFVYDFGTYAHFLNLNMLGWYGILGVMTSVPVQLIFVERSVRINNNNKTILIISLILALATFSGGLATTISTRGMTLLTMTKAVTVIIRLWPTACFSAHIFNTVTIVVGLLRNRTGSASADKLIWKLVGGCLEAQLPATLFAFVCMVVILNNVNSPLIPFLLITHPKVYMTGALAMINMRHKWRKEGKTPSSYATSEQSVDSKQISAPGLSSTSSGTQELPEPATPTLGFLKRYSERSKEMKSEEGLAQGPQGLGLEHELKF